MNQYCGYFVQAMKKVIRSIEIEQGALNLEQAALIYDICIAINVRPGLILGRTVRLIAPPAPNPLLSKEIEP